MTSGMLAIVLGFLAASASAESSEVRVPSLESLVASTDACTGKVSSDEKMRKIWTAAGWEPGTQAARGGIVLSSYRRNDVHLHFATASIMKTCSVWANIPADYDVDALVRAVTVKLNKAPKVEEAGKRYYFQNYRGLKILSLLVKEDIRGRYVELSVVH